MENDMDISTAAGNFNISAKK